MPRDALAVPGQLGEEVRVAADDRLAEQVLHVVEQLGGVDEVPDFRAGLVPVGNLVRIPARVLRLGQELVEVVPDLGHFLGRPQPDGGDEAVAVVVRDLLRRQLVRALDAEREEAQVALQLRVCVHDVRGPGFERRGGRLLPELLLLRRLRHRAPSSGPPVMDSL